MKMRGFFGALAAAGTLGGMSGLAHADEVTVKNDSLANGGTAAICPCFTESEEAAVWLTSPCNGNIVALQVFWKSQFGGAQQTLENALVVYQGGNFPVPGLVKEELLGPVLTDGGMNEFRYMDDQQTIPISIPVTAGEEFVVAIEFGNDNAGDFLAASVASDDDGCQNGKNAVRVNGTTWTSSCSLGVSGDWIIRAIIDCNSEPTGAACMPDGSCAEGLTEEEAIALGGVWYGVGSNCTSISCTGACFVPATGQCLQFDLDTCTAVGGTWAGPGTTECPPACPADFTGEGDLDIFDVFAFLDAYEAMEPEADFTDDGIYDIFDVFGFLDAYTAGCPG